MEINDRIVHELFLNPELRKSDTRTVIFLLSNPGALSSDELSKGIGISGKSVSKSIKRLISAGIIHAGELQAKKRTFVVQLSEPKEHQEVTEKENRETFDSFMDRFDRIEEMIASMMGTKGACFNPAPAHDGQKVTGISPICSHVDEGKNIQDKKNLESIPKVTEPVSVVIEPGTNEPQNDSIVSDLDTALLHAGARLAALKAASFNQEKQKQPGARTSIDDEFHALFGVQLPVGSDMAAVGVMIARKKAGKLDVKSPLAYLSSISGKVAPVESKCPPSGQMNPVGMSIETTSGISSVSDRLSHADISRINDLWDAMTGEQRMPYETAALPKFEKQVGKYKVPIHLLAKSVFNNEQVRNMGGMI